MTDGGDDEAERQEGVAWRRQRSDLKERQGQYSHRGRVLLRQGRQCHGERDGRRDWRDKASDAMELPIRESGLESEKKKRSTSSSIAWLRETGEPRTWVDRFWVLEQC